MGDRLLRRPHTAPGDPDPRLTNLSQLVRRSGVSGSLRRNRQRFIGGVGSDQLGRHPAHFRRDPGSVMSPNGLDRPAATVTEPSAAAHRWIRAKRSRRTLPEVGAVRALGGPN